MKNIKATQVKVGDKIDVEHTPWGKKTSVHQTLTVSSVKTIEYWYGTVVEFSGSEIVPNPERLDGLTSVSKVDDMIKVVSR